MARTRVKICGLTRAEDAAAAAELGADAIGLNFVGGPRRIDRHVALKATEPLPPLIDIVALCDASVPPEAEFSAASLLSGYPGIKITVFQLYRAVLEHLPMLGRPIKVWPVFSVASRDSLVDIYSSVAGPGFCGIWPTSVSAILFDTASSDKLGGTGRSFDWNWIAEARGAGELEGLPPIILAGGLTPENVGEAIRIARPYAVDVSSGVEVAGKPGVKDAVKMRDFIQAVRGADT